MTYIFRIRYWLFNIYNYYTYNVQIVFCSIITLTAINCSFLFFFFLIAHGTWRYSVAMSNFFVPAKNTSGPGWSSVATAGTSMGWLILVQLSLHLSCLCSSSLIFNLQDWKVEHVEIIVVPGKREGIYSHCLWFPDAKTHINPIAY